MFYFVSGSDADSMSGCWTLSFWHVYFHGEASQLRSKISLHCPNYRLMTDSQTYLYNIFVINKHKKEKTSSTWKYSTWFSFFSDWRLILIPGYSILDGCQHLYDVFSLAFNTVHFSCFVFTSAVGKNMVIEALRERFKLMANSLITKMDVKFCKTLKGWINMLKNICT